MLKGQQDGSSWKEGKTCLKRYKLEQKKPILSCIAVSILVSGFPAGLRSDSPLLSQALSSRAGAGVCIRHSDVQDPGSRGAQGTDHRPSRQLCMGWSLAGMVVAKPPAHRWPKRLLAGKAGTAAT